MVLNTKNQDTRYWCDYCRIFVYNNRINREKHEASPQHVANFKKRVETLRREEQELERNRAAFGTNSKVSSGSGSFYNKTTNSLAYEQGSEIKNVLNIKSATGTGQTRKKKPILGLVSTNASQIAIKGKISNPHLDLDAETTNMKARTSIDIKTTAKDLKRKIIEDEEKSRSLPTVTASTEHDDLETQRQEEEEDAVNLTDLFKKKTKKSSF